MKVKKKLISPRDTHESPEKSPVVQAFLEKNEQMKKIESNLLVVDKQEIRKTRTRSNSPALSKNDAKPPSRQSLVLSKYKQKKNDSYDLNAFLDTKIMD